MTRAEVLLQGEYKGMEISIVGEDESGGRKLVLFDYPHSDSRSIQDMGGLPQDFSIKCVIHGANYIADSERFRALLLDGEKGELIMQTIGAVDVYTATYSKSFKQTKIGAIYFDVSFKIEDMLGEMPQFEDVTAQDVNQNSDEALDALADSVAFHKVLPTTASNALQLKQDISDFADTMRDGFNDIGEMAGKVEDVMNNVEQAIYNTDEFIKDMVLDSPFGIIMTAGINAFDRCKNVAGYGHDLATRIMNTQSTSQLSKGGDTDNVFEENDDFSVPLWGFDTIEIKERDTARLVLVETIRAGSLISTMQQTTIIDKDTLEAVQGIKDTITNLVDDLVNGDQEKLIFDDDSFLSGLLEMQKTTFQYLFLIEQGLYHQTQIDVNFITPSVLAHNLYVDEEQTRENIESKAEMLINMNGAEQIFQGDTTVLEKS